MRFSERILNKNKDPEILCRGIIGFDGKLGGYNEGTKKKRRLLKKKGVL